MAKKNVPASSVYDGLLAQRNKKSAKATFAVYLPLYLMMLPGFIYLICNNYLPMFGILIAFKNVNFSVGVFKSPWVGFKNFEFLFATNDAFLMIRNTLLYNIVWIAMGLVIAVTIAIFMAEISERKIAKVIQPIICFPSMISAVILSYIVYGFLSTNYGFINQIMGTKTNFYTKAQYWPFILTIVHFWQSAGQSSIIYMASIGGIDKSMYEAARIDGAGKLKQILYITLPMLRPMIILLLLLSIGRIFNSDFGLFYQVTLNSGRLYKTTQTIDTYVYRALMEMNNVGMSSAASVFQAIIGFVLVLLSNLIVRRIDPQSALF
ncbi:MAG: sugar ABC transporter permease [Lachnospiraceae bacterium]|nr:sugar ABC transporter permease [Lachnospiraceae bacterium]